MRSKQASLWLALLAAFALFAAACGDDDPETTTTPEEPPAEEAMADDPEPPEEPEEPIEEPEEPEGPMAMPGDGVSVSMARADWSTGYFQAQVLKQLMEELGYDVSEPSERELGPSLAYLAMAEGDIDVWANGWYPLHDSWLAAELPDGSLVGDHVSSIGELMVAGGLQGYLVTKSVADEHGITHLDQINDDPALTALFDSDGDGVAEMFGCPESWTCDDIMTSQIAFSEWDNITQTIAGYDAMVAEAQSRVDAGEPVVLYTWTPSAYITQFRPGDNVVWLAVEEVIDDSNPTGAEGGELHDQRPGTANIGPDQCPAAAEMGTCQLGWTAADILVTANDDFMAANPAAEELFRQVRISVIDVSLANVEQSAGMDTEADIAQLAADWIADNRDTADEWIAAATAAG